MKLYVGVSREGSCRLLVARRLAESIEYELCWKGIAGKVETLSFAILAEYLGDEEQARKVCAGFARLMGARLHADFWTLRESEIAEAMAAIS